MRLAETIAGQQPELGAYPAQINGGNTEMADALRDLILFHVWPADWGPVMLKLAAFAALSLAAGWALAARQMRRAR